MDNAKGLPVKVGIGLDNSILQHSTSAGNFFYMAYPKEKLADPNWQKKRLKIFNRDRFKCVLCGNDKIQLDCHHLEYIYGKELWDYPDDNFMTLCHTCHKIADHVRTFKDKPVDAFYIDGGNYTTIYMTMTGEMVLRYTFDTTDNRFTAGGIFTVQEMKLLTAKKRCKNG